MQSLDDLKERYGSLDWKGPIEEEEAVDAGCLIALPYDYPGSGAEVTIDTDEFTAVCPLTGLPDFGTLTVRYVPDRQFLELKSLKYYLLGFRSVGIYQEHAANRILRDLAAACLPVTMTLTLDYKTRGGLHTSVTATLDQSGER